MVRWENKPSIHTQLLRAYLALVRLSCFWKEVIVIDSSWLPICTKMNCKIIFTQYTVSQKCIIFEATEKVGVENVAPDIGWKPRE